MDNSAQTSPAECLVASASYGSCSLNPLIAISSDSYIVIQFGPSLVVDVPLIYKCHIFEKRFMVSHSVRECTIPLE